MTGVSIPTAAVAIHFMYYNFGRIHQTLRVTPAMQAGLAVLARELCERCRVVTFSEKLVEVPAYRGLALADVVVKSQAHLGTYLGHAMQIINQQPYDRVVVITDEQSHDRVPGPKGKGYLINVASNQHGVGYGPWTHIDGWSERVLSYIQEVEQESGLTGGSDAA